MHLRHAVFDPAARAGLADALHSFAASLAAPVEISAGCLHLQLPSGAIKVAENRLHLSAQDPRALFQLQQLVLRQTAAMASTPRLDWDHVDVGDLPPNLSPATVLRLERISPGFVRVRLALADIERFAVDALHFRLVIPAVLPARGGAITAWPRIGATGATLWPEGDAALHRPVYTVAAVNPAEGWLDFDVHLHAGGRVTAWTRQVRPGDRIAIMGPTRLRRDLGPWVGLYGDDTALPAIRLYLASLPADTRGEAVITLQDMADRQELAAPAGMQISWYPWRPAVLLGRVLQAPLGAEQGYLYAGCERQEADAIRDHARVTLGLAKERFSITAFWSAEA